MNAPTFKLQRAGLVELAKRCEAATSPDRELDAEICLAIGYAGENSDGAVDIRLDADWPGDLLFEIDGEECCNPIPNLTSSLDDAMKLVPEGYAWGAGSGTNDADVDGWAWCGPDEGPYSFAATPALALTAASLRVRAALCPLAGDQA